MGKVALILGIIGVVIGGAVFLVSVMLPPLTNGRTSWEEAMLGIIPGFILLFLSLILAVIGLIFTLKKKKAQQP